MQKKILVGYHAQCPDGFTSAWAAWREFGDSAEYVPLSYKGDRPDWTGKEVYLLDFCLPLEELKLVESQAESVIVLDHHKTSEGIIANFEGSIFDNNRSGCGITWDYFHGEETRPELVNHVEDRDLWVWQKPNSEAYCMHLDCYPMEFKTWTALGAQTEKEYADFVQEGSVMIKQFRSIAQTLAETGKRVRFGGQVGFACNGPNRLNSLVGQYLAEKSGTFGLVWRCDDGENVYISLRSLAKTGYDVSVLAQKFGGGGHKCASGIVLPLEEFFRAIDYLSD